MDHATVFGHEVRDLRRALDLTQDELARRVGCAAITIRKIEAGDLRPSQQIADRLALALSLPPQDRAEFVRQARATPLPHHPLTPTPQITPDEIGLPDLSGRAIRGYTLGEQLGAGSCGVVYRGVQPLVERDVAIKIIRPQYANQPDFIRRFEAEAQLVARLEHPHIVPLYDYWREPGVAYLVMRLLRGGSLRDRLARGPLPLDQITRLIEQLCAALLTAHRAGVIHRDLKASNVLLDEDGNAYLADFGIARAAADVSPQIDVWALGDLMAQLLMRADLPVAFDELRARLALQPYAEVDALLADFKQVAQTGRLMDVAPAVSAHPIEISNPYKGLRPFEEADAADFFGRETLTQHLLARLGEDDDLQRFLAIVGPSGSGKSSVVKAGLIPALRRGGLPHSEHWFVIDVLPGPHPLEEIEAALLRIAVNPPSSMLSQIREDERGLLRAIQRSLPDDDSELVLVLDQFEEVFTLVEDEAERAQLLAALVAAVLAERSRVRVITTLRADFLDQPLRYVDFAELIQRRSQLVLPLTPDEIERAIVAPAQRAGVCVEAGLAEAITADVIDQPGGLPLLQYALTELFEQRTDHTLTKRVYQAIGGVRGALGRRAEEVYTALDETSQILTKQIFLRLVTLGEGTEDVRRRVARTELEALTNPTSNLQLPTSKILAAFGKARLLSFDRDAQTRGPTVEVAHEALLREWPRLRDWLSASRSEVRLQRLLANEVAEWLKANRDASFLLHGSRLQQFEDWARTTSIALTSEERAYLEASLTEREQQRLIEEARRVREAKLERRAKRVLQGLFAVAVIAALISGALALLATNREQEAQSQRQEAVTQKQIAEDQKQEALRQASIGLAAQAVNELQGTSPERAVLIALEALEKYPYTGQAESALARAVEEGKLYRDYESDYRQSVYSRVVWSPDGQRIAGGNTDKGGTVIVWEVSSGRTLSLLSDTAGLYADCGVTDMTWSPDGARLAIISSSWGPGTPCAPPQIWDLATNTPIVTLTIPSSSATSVAWSHNGQYLLTTQVDGTVRIWNAQQGMEILALSGHGDSVRDAAWSKADDRIVTGAADRTAKIWDARTGRELFTLGGHTNAVVAVVWSPDGQHVATASADRTARIWDSASGAAVNTLGGHTAPLLDIDWSSDGERIATTGLDGVTRSWDAATGTLLTELRGPVTDRAKVAWSPQDRHLAFAGFFKPRIWDLSERTLSLPAVNTDWAVDARWSPDGARIAVTSYDGTARIWDAVTGKPLQLLIHPNLVFNFDWAPNSRYLVTGNNDGISRIWDANTGDLIGEHHSPAGNMAVAEDWSPSGELIATSTWPSYTLEIWDPATGQNVMIVENGCNLFKPSWSPDGQQFATACAFTDADDNPPARIWDSHTGQLLMALNSQDGEPMRIRWSPDSKRLAVTYQKGTVRIYDAVTWEELLTFGGHTQAVWDVIWSLDGTRVVSGDDAGNVIIWDTTTGEEVLILKAPARVSSIDWSPDGRYVLLGGSFNTPLIKRVWQSTDELIQYAKECCVARELTAAERQQFGLAAK